MTFLFSGGAGPGKVTIIIEAVSKLGFWFKVAAGPSFHAKPDDPSDRIFFVGLKPQAYTPVFRGFKAHL